jgi:hypothetical protein
MLDELFWLSHVLVCLLQDQEMLISYSPDSEISEDHSTSSEYSIEAGMQILVPFIKAAGLIGVIHVHTTGG